MKKYLLFGAVITCALAMISCSEWLEPEGEIVNRWMEVSGSIDRIETGDGITLVLTDDVPAGEAVIITHGNVQPYIKAETTADKVTFTVNAKRFKNLDVTIEASLSQYRDFTASGGARIYTEGQLSLPEAEFNVSGGSQATFSGECASAGIECSGGSVFYGYGLTVGNAEVVNTGGSKLEITVTQSLTGENSGGSNISYKGTPSILNVNNTGGSTTTKEE